MDRRWMHGTRPSVEYLNGVNGFINVAKQQASKEDIDAYGSSFIYCPCKDCKNEKKFRSHDIVFQYLISVDSKRTIHVGTNTGRKVLMKGRRWRILLSMISPLAKMMWVIF